MDGEGEGIDGVAVWDGMGVYVQTHNGPHSPTHTDVCATTKIQLEILQGSWATLFQGTASSLLGRSIHTHTHHTVVWLYLPTLLYWVGIRNRHSVAITTFIARRQRALQCSRVITTLAIHASLG